MKGYTILSCTFAWDMIHRSTCIHEYIPPLYIPSVSNMVLFLMYGATQYEYGITFYSILNITIMFGTVQYVVSMNTPRLPRIHVFIFILF